MQGAGGIGGLLVQATSSDSGVMQHLVGYDANGNVMNLIDANNGMVSATYAYDPYGRELSAEGVVALKYPFRFSTKCHDDETGLVYYGYRFYKPSLGRFLNVDPAADLSFAFMKMFGIVWGVEPSVFDDITTPLLVEDYANVYRFVDNNSTDNTDYLGLAPKWQKCTPPKVWGKKPGGVIPKPDGCSAPAVLPGTPNNPTKKCSFKLPCNGHDKCYSNCSTSKSDCDKNFKRDMRNACTICAAKMPVGKKRLKFLDKCHKTADRFAWGVDGRIGRKAYKNRQTKNCGCICP